MTKRKLGQKIFNLLMITILIGLLTAIYFYSLSSIPLDTSTPSSSSSFELQQTRDHNLNCGNAFYWKPKQKINHSNPLQYHNWGSYRPGVYFGRLL